MNQEPRPKLTIQPSAAERHETMDTLTGGKPVVEPTPNPAKAADVPTEAGTPPFNRANAEPGGAAIIQAIAKRHDDGLSDDQDNQSDGRADVLPS